MKKQMKKIIRIALLLFMLLILITIKNKVKASTSATVYSGEAISIEKSNDVDVVSNDVNIDLTTSKVTNTFILKNLKNSNLITKITAKLEDEKTSFSIKDLSIKVNNLEIKNIEKNKDDYIFKIEIPSEGYKKIEINYTTENDLKNAKILRYNIEKLKGKNIKKFNINFKIPEEDIPLVKRIYPECFEFDEDNQTINVKYYDFTVNNLTKDFIIQKETWKNLLYGEEYEKNEFEEEFYPKAKKMILEGIENDFEKYVEYSWSNYLGGKEEEVYYFKPAEFFSDKIGKKLELDFTFKDNTLNSVLKYIIYKQAKKDGIIKIKNAYIFEYNYGSYPLVKDCFYKYNFSKLDGNLYNKKVCIDYVESEGDKELYIKSDHVEQPIKKEELEILKKYPSCIGEPDAPDVYDYNYKNGCYRIINVALDINGEKIEASEQEIAEYVNMIGTDLYIRKVIYDGYVETTGTHYGIEGGILIPKISEIIAYYTDNNKENAYNYLMDDYFVNTYIDSESIKKFENETISEYSKVPTITQCVGFRTTENGKYIVTYFTRFSGKLNGLGNINKVIETASSKDLLNENNKNNEEKANNIDNEIKNIAIETDSKEYEDKKEIITNKAEEMLPENIKDKINLNIYELIFAGGLALAIIINIIIIIRKRGKKNGK